MDLSQVEDVVIVGGGAAGCSVTPSAAPRDLSTTGDPMFQSPFTFGGFPTITLARRLPTEGACPRDSTRTRCRSGCSSARRTGRRRGCCQSLRGARACWAKELRQEPVRAGAGHQFVLCSKTYARLKRRRTPAPHRLPQTASPGLDAHYRQCPRMGQRVPCDRRGQERHSG